MGCGGSSVRVKQKEEGGKYKETDEKVSPTARGGSPGSPKSPRKGEGDLSPKKRKKGGKQSPRKEKGSPRMFKKANTMMDLNEAESDTTTYTLPLRRMSCRTDAKEEGFTDIKLLTKGQMVLQRGPPLIETAHPLTMVPDFSPRFGLNLNASEAEQIKMNQAEHTIEFGELTASKLIKSRLRKPKFMGYSLRPIAGFCKSLAAVAISSDDRLVAVAMSRGKAIPLGDGPIVNGLPLSSSRSSTQMNSRGSSAGSVPGQVKIDSFTRIIRCLDLRTGMMVGLLKQKGFDPEATSDMMFGVDDQHLMSCTTEGSVLIWHMGRMRLHKAMEESASVGRLSQVRVSPNGKFVAACGEDIDDDGNAMGQVSVWYVDGGKHCHSFSRHKAPVVSLAFHPDNVIVASGDRKGVVCLWECETGYLLNKITSHTITIRSVHFPSGTELLTADERFTRLWKISPEMDNEVPVWTRHLDTEEPIMFDVDNPGEQMEIIEEEDEESEDNEEEENPADDEDAKKTEGDDNESPTGSPRVDEKKKGGKRPRGPGPYKRYPLLPPPDQSKLRQRSITTLPCGVLLVCLSIREVHLLDGFTGQKLAVIPTKSPVSCAHGGRSIVVMGDIWGNVYALDIEMDNTLPSVT